MKSLLLSAFLFAFSSTAALAQTATSADAWGETPAAEQQEAPRYNTGWNTAPGQSLSLHDRPSTDYWGRPLKKKSKNLSTAPAKEVAYADEAAPAADPMMQSSGVMIAPGMNTAPYRGVSTDYWGRPLKKKPAKRASTLAKSVNKTAPVAARNTTAGW